MKVNRHSAARQLSAGLLLAVGLMAVCLLALAWPAPPAAEARTNAADPPVSPTLTSPADGTTTNSTPTFAWVAVSGATNYDIRIDLADTPHNVTAPSFTPTTTLEGGVHYWQVRSCDNTTCGVYSAVSQFTVDATPPGQPPLAAPAEDTYTNTTRPTFTWGAVTDSDLAGYKVWIDSTTNLTNTSTSFTPASALADTVHHWTVRAFDVVGNYSPCETTRTLTVDTQVPPTPSGLSPASGATVTTSTVTFSWGAVTDNGPAGLASYYIWIDGTAHASATNSYNSGDLSSGGHTWQVEACDKAGNCSYSLSVQFTFSPPTPGVPTLLLPADGAATAEVRPTFTWDAPASGSPPTGYNIVLGSQTYTVTSSTSYQPSADLSDGSYGWKVRAFDAHTQGSYTAARTLIVDTHAPTVTFTMLGQAGRLPIGVRWAAIDTGAGVAGYSLAYREAAGAWQTLLSNSANTSYSLNTGTEGLTYTFVVTATDRAGNADTDTKAVLFKKFTLLAPTQMRDFMGLANGSFENGLSGWTTGGELNVTTSATAGVTDGQKALLLGNPSYNNQNGVPVGNGRVSQTFTVPGTSNPTLTLSYHVYTYDFIWSANYSRYYDSFEIYIGNTDWSKANSPDAADSVRKARCRDNPGVADASAAGLVFCDGEHSTGGQPLLRERQGTVTLPLAAFKGQNIVLSLANFNRVDGYWNTWTYVDNVKLNP